jgi:hypothetical protein
MNQVWIVPWIVLIRERLLAMQKSKKHDPAIAHIFAFCLVDFQTEKTSQGISFLGAGACWLQRLYYPMQQKEMNHERFRDCFLANPQTVEDIFDNI